MSEAASAWMAAPASITTASVKAVRGARVDVESPSFGSACARLAVAGPYEPRAGDAVLVASADGACFVIGVLRALREVEGASPPSPAARSITADDGSSASLEQGEDGPVWRLRDASGRLLFEHGAGKSVVCVHEDLEVRAAGDLSLSAGGAVRIEGGERAALSSRGAVELSSRGSAVRLDGERAGVSGELFELRAQRADVTTKEANLVVGTLRSVAHRVREKAEVVERTAGRVVERAREVYREVEGLEQTKAGRLRLVASAALTLLGQQALLKAREDVKLKGEKIYLG